MSGVTESGIGSGCNFLTEIDPYGVASESYDRRYSRQAIERIKWEANTFEHPTASALHKETYSAVVNTDSRDNVTTSSIVASTIVAPGTLTTKKKKKKTKAETVLGYLAGVKSTRCWYDYNGILGVPPDECSPYRAILDRTAAISLRENSLSEISAREMVLLSLSVFPSFTCLQLSCIGA